MKRITALLVLLMVLCAALPALAGSSVNGVRYRVSITMPAGHDHIYLYDQPSSSNGKNLGRINNGEYVTGISSVQRKGYTWIYCNYNGTEGYIRKNNLVEVGNSSGSGNTSSVSGSVSSGDSGNVTFSGSVNVRTGPGLDYGKLGSVNKGQSLNYAGDTQYDNRGVAWYSVYYNGRTGWVSSKYASVKGGTSGNISSSASSGNGRASTNYSSSYYNPDGGFINHSIRSVSGNSNVRTGPGLGYASIGILYKGEGATYCDQISYDNRGVVWYYVRFCGEYGWVSSRYTIID